jgi:predicted PurR-regulated permease PerM
VSFAIIVMGLYFGKEFFIPFALAVLVCFLVVPVVDWLEHMRLGRIPSVLIVVVLITAIFCGVGLLFIDQLSELAQNLQNYRETIVTKLHTIQSGTGFLRVAAASIQDAINAALGARSAQQPTSPEAVLLVPGRHEAATPQPVSINGLDLIRGLVGPLLGPLAMLGISAVLVLFILIQREDLRDRLIGLVGKDKLTITTKAMNDARRRITRFLFAQLVVNVSFGILIGLGLLVLGVPNPLLWGVLGALLRYVPYIGSWIAMTGPLLLAFATKDWTIPVYTAVLFIVLELSLAYIAEPWIYGANTGITSFAVLVAAFFWTMIWGAAGLLLAIPLTVCLVVLARYVPPLSFIAIALGAEPALENYTRFYQRVLAMDRNEAESILAQELEHKPLKQVYHEVVEPARHLLEKDYHRRRISAELFDSINKFMLTLLENANLKHAVHG